MPVLPDVGSTMVPPGLSAPLVSAASTIASAMRSLTEPPGLLRSLLIQTSAALPNRRCIRMCGVLPIVARTLRAFIESLLGVGSAAGHGAHRRGNRDNRMVKQARPPLGQSSKGGPGGRSGLHRAA